MPAGRPPRSRVLPLAAGVLLAAAAAAWWLWPRGRPGIEFMSHSPAGYETLVRGADAVPVDDPALPAAVRAVLAKSLDDLPYGVDPTDDQLAALEDYLVSYLRLAEIRDLTADDALSWGERVGERPISMHMSSLRNIRLGLTTGFGTGAIGDPAPPALDAEAAAEEYRTLFEEADNFDAATRRELWGGHRTNVVTIRPSVSAVNFYDNDPENVRTDTRFGISKHFQRMYHSVYVVPAMFGPADAEPGGVTIVGQMLLVVETVRDRPEGERREVVPLEVLLTYRPASGRWHLGRVRYSRLAGLNPDHRYHRDGTWLGEHAYAPMF